MTWGWKFFGMNVKIAWNGPRNCSVRNILIAFNNSILRIPETELNTVTKYHDWSVKHLGFGKEILDALWFFCQREYDWK
jgi:hypothetical protein